MKINLKCGHKSFSSQGNKTAERNSDFLYNREKCRQTKGVASLFLESHHTFLSPLSLFLVASRALIVSMVAGSSLKTVSACRMKSRGWEDTISDSSVGTHAQLFSDGN